MIASTLRRDSALELSFRLFLAERIVAVAGASRRTRVSYWRTSGRSSEQQLSVVVINRDLHRSVCRPAPARLLPLSSQRIAAAAPQAVAYP